MRDLKTPLLVYLCVVTKRGTYVLSPNAPPFRHAVSDFKHITFFYQVLV